MSLPAKREGNGYRYKDYLTWSDNDRWEIIDGIPYSMSPSPSWQHQSVLGEIYKQIAVYLTGKPCRVFVSPFDVRLPVGGEDLESKSVVQPDITVICDRSKLKGTGYSGTPELIIEVVPPSTGKMDRLLKFNQYEKAGVKEYWIVDPLEKVVMVFKLNNENSYGRPEVYSEDDTVKVGIFEDLAVDLKGVFID